MTWKLKFSCQSLADCRFRHHVDPVVSLIIILSRISLDEVEEDPPTNLNHDIATTVHPASSASSYFVLLVSINWTIVASRETGSKRGQRNLHQNATTSATYKKCDIMKTRGQSNLTKSASRGAHSPVRGHPRGSKVVPLNSWGRVSY